MKFKKIKLYIFLAFSVICGSCCKYQISAPLEIKFENFDFSSLDSVMLISTDINNINAPIDTVIHNLSSQQTINLWIYDNNSLDGVNRNYIIRNNNPQFEHTITDINPERKKTLGCSGSGVIKYSFRFDGTQYNSEKKHTIIIKP